MHSLCYSMLACTLQPPPRNYVHDPPSSTHSYDTKHIYILSPSGAKAKQKQLQGTYIGKILLRVAIRYLASIICTKISTPAENYSLERRKYLMRLNGPSCRAEANVGRPFGDTVGLMSHPSTFFGTQTSNRIWPRTPLGSMQGGWDMLRL